MSFDKTLESSSLSARVSCKSRLRTEKGAKKGHDPSASSSEDFRRRSVGSSSAAVFHMCGFRQLRISELFVSGRDGRWLACQAIFQPQSIYKLPAHASRTRASKEKRRNATRFPAVAITAARLWPHRCACLFIWTTIFPIPRLVIPGPIFISRPCVEHPASLAALLTWLENEQRTEYCPLISGLERNDVVDDPYPYPVLSLGHPAHLCLNPILLSGTSTAEPGSPPVPKCTDHQA